VKHSIFFRVMKQWCGLQECTASVFYSEAIISSETSIRMLDIIPKMIAVFIEELQLSLKLCCICFWTLW